MGHIITLMNKSPGLLGYTPELLHMAKKTNDPGAAPRSGDPLLSRPAYYQKAAEFSDILTATFPPGSPGAAAHPGGGHRAAACSRPMPRCLI